MLGENGEPLFINVSENIALVLDLESSPLHDC